MHTSVGLEYEPSLTPLHISQVRGWRGDAEVGALLEAKTTAALERALTLALEAVGSALQVFVFALVTGSLSLKLSDTRVYAPQIRAQRSLHC